MATAPGQRNCLGGRDGASGPEHVLVIEPVHPLRLAQEVLGGADIEDDALRGLRG